MNNEDKKKFLKEYKNTIDKLSSIEEQKMSIIESITSAKAISYSDMPKGNKKSDISDIMVKLEDINNKIDDLRIICIKKKVIIESAILNLKDAKQSEVLRKKYLQFKSWEVICTEIGYEWANTHRIHAMALKNIELNDMF